MFFLSLGCFEFVYCLLSTCAVITPDLYWCKCEQDFEKVANVCAFLFEKSLIDLFFFCLFVFMTVPQHVCGNVFAMFSSSETTKLKPQLLCARFLKSIDLKRAASQCSQCYLHNALYFSVQLQALWSMMIAIPFFSLPERHPATGDEWWRNLSLIVCVHFLSRCRKSAQLFLFHSLLKSAFI